MSISNTEIQDQAIEDAANLFATAEAEAAENISRINNAFKNSTALLGILLDSTISPRELWLHTKAFQTELMSAISIEKKTENQELKIHGAMLALQIAMMKQNSVMGHIKYALSVAAHGIKFAAKQAAAGLTYAAQKTLEGVKALLKGALNILKKCAEAIEVLGWYIKCVAKIIIAPALINAAKNVRDTIIAAWNNLVKAFDDFKNEIKHALIEIKTALKALPGQIAEAFDTLGAEIHLAISNAEASIGRGIRHVGLAIAHAGQTIVTDGEKWVEIEEKNLGRKQPRVFLNYDLPPTRHASLFTAYDAATIATQTVIERSDSEPSVGPTTPTEPLTDALRLTV